MEHDLKFVLGANLFLMTINAFLFLINIVVLCKFIEV